MFSAVMKYQFKQNCAEKGVKIWRELVLPKAVLQNGLISMQLFTEGSNSAWAIGIWNSQNDAAKFMKTGIFQEILSRLNPLLEGQPAQQKWEINAYLERDKCLFPTDTE